MSYIEKSKGMLKDWVEYSKKDLYVCPDRTDLICYGSGYNGWGMQTHQKGFAAFAVAATEEGMEENLARRQELLECSLKMLRFMLETHLEGSYACLDGTKWGHTWISVLGMERMMHGVERLMGVMTREDQTLLRKVMISEADWLMDCYDIRAHERDESRSNKPESNIWNGAFLHRVAMMYPDCQRAEEYREKGTKYLVNGISVPADRTSQEIYDGKPISEWYVGNNFFESYSLDHHGYLNVGYMVICLSNIAMLHFSCKRYDKKAPKALYHHGEELWRLIKTCMFRDGRLVRIGGDTRVRYCYCQDYVLPALLFIRDYYGDSDCEQLESALVDLFYQESVYNGDGSFLSKRCASFEILSPIYYTRLESDKADVLSMLLAWRNIAAKGGREISKLKSWKEKYHGACLERGENRFASWVWRGAMGAQGLCLPIGKGDLAEWGDNLAGEIRGMTPNYCNPEYAEHTELQFDGGFLTYGTMNRWSKGFVAEQQKDEITAVHKIVYAALPDDATVVVMQYAHTVNRTYIKSIQGIKYNVPNDVFNHCKRTYYFDNGQKVKEGLDGKKQVIKVKDNWVNVDQILGVIKCYGEDGLHIYCPGERNVGIQNVLYQEATQNLCSDVICGKLILKPVWANGGEVVLDEGGVILAGADKEYTKKIAEKSSPIRIIGGDGVRSIVVTGMDQREYIVLANFSRHEQEVTIKLPENMECLDLIKAKPCSHTISLSAGSGKILVALKK